MKKKVVTTIVALSTFAAGVMSAQAASNIEQIQASLNRGIKFVVNGNAWTPKDGNGAAVAPISYKGTTYVPLRAVAEATGADIKWDGASQTITINAKGQETSSSSPSQPVRKPFSTDTVSYLEWDGNYNPNGITHNKEDLLFGETQYQTAFMVSDVGSGISRGGVGFKVKEGTKKVGVLVGFKNNDEEDDPLTASYTIKDKDGNALATGSVKAGTVVENTLDLPDGVTELNIQFEVTSSFLKEGKGFLIWDGSWVE